MAAAAVVYPFIAAKGVSGRCWLASVTTAVKSQLPRRRFADNSVCHEVVDYPSISGLLAVKHKVPGSMTAHPVDAVLMPDFMPEVLLEMENKINYQLIRQLLYRIRSEGKNVARCDRHPSTTFPRDLDQPHAQQ